MPSALVTDLYQISMMAGYHALGDDRPRTFELFVRTLPPHRRYLIAAGLDTALDYLEALRFTADEIAWLRDVPALGRVPAPFFDDFLPRFAFTGEVWAVEEGEPVFPNEPLLRVTAPASQAQLVETALLAIVTQQTSVASKAARVVRAAAGRPVVEFGGRRAPGLEASVLAARAACIAGCVGTSSVEAGRRFDLPVSGTMAHSWVMSFPDEIESFRGFMALFGDETTLLIDTWDTVAAARRIVDEGLRPAAVRLDSGDLLQLARDVRAVLDAGGLRGTRIMASGDLDEYKIARLLGEGAPIDAFGVGTSISAVTDAPALGGVYKLVETTVDGAPEPVFKRSTGKVTLPGRKQVWRVMEGSSASHDVLALEGETIDGARPLLRRVMRDGRRLAPPVPVSAMQAHCLERLQELPADVRDRLDDAPAPSYRVEQSRGLVELTARVSAARESRSATRPRG